MGVELSADGMELVFEPFEVFLGGYMWKKLIDHVFEGDWENDETSFWWLARCHNDVSC